MKNLATLVALVIFSTAAVNAQDKTAATPIKKVESKATLQKATPVATEAQKQAVLKKSANVKRVTGKQMMNQQQLNAHKEERKKTQPTNGKTKTDNQ